MLKRFNKLENEQQQQVLVMLETSVNLSRSHWYKEKFLEILDCNDRETAKEKMQEYCRISSFEAMYYAKFCFVGATGSSPVTLRIITILRWLQMLKN